MSWHNLPLDLNLRKISQWLLARRCTDVESNFHFIAIFVPRLVCVLRLNGVATFVCDVVSSLCVFRLDDSSFGMSDRWLGDALLFSVASVSSVLVNQYIAMVCLPIISIALPMILRPPTQVQKNGYI